MSTLTVVRHGQARPFDSNPDQLSALGEEQARALGLYWERMGIVFDEVWSGSLQRQRQTAELATSAAAQVSDDWNEYDANGILHNFAPPYELEPGADRNRKFQKVFEPAMLAWLAAEEHPKVERGACFALAFCGRSRAFRKARRIATSRCSHRAARSACWCRQRLGRRSGVFSR